MATLRYYHEIDSHGTDLQQGLKNVSFKFLCALEEAIVDLESNTFYKQKGKSDDQCQRVLDAFLNIKDEFLVQEFEYRVKVGKSRDYMKELVEKNDKHFMAFIAVSVITLCNVRADTIHSGVKTMNDATDLALLTC